MAGKVGFIGLGRMGQPMASNLQRKGFSLSVHDVRNQPVEALVALGAENGGSVAQVAKECKIIVTMLPGSPDVTATIMGPDGIAANAQPGTLVMDMSTIDPLTTDELATHLKAKDMILVDAPVGRLASHADAGESLFMVGAGDAQFAVVKPMLEAMGTAIYHCGPVGAGIRTKLINNFLAIASCQMNAEALSLAAAFGLDLDKTLDVIHGTTATNGQLKVNYATKVLTGDIEPGFTIDLAHKDLSLVVEAANAGRVPMPMAAVAREALSLARSGEFGLKDFSALLDHWCARAGLPKVRLPDASQQ